MNCLQSSGGTGARGHLAPLTCDSTPAGARSARNLQIDCNVHLWEHTSIMSAPIQSSRRHSVRSPIFVISSVSSCLTVIWGKSCETFRTIIFTKKPVSLVCERQTNTFPVLRPRKSSLINLITDDYACYACYTYYEYYTMLRILRMLHMLLHITQ